VVGELSVASAAVCSCSPAGWPSLVVGLLPKKGRAGWALLLALATLPAVLLYPSANAGGFSPSCCGLLAGVSPC